MNASSHDAVPTSWHHRHYRSPQFIDGPGEPLAARLLGSVPNGRIARGPAIEESGHPRALSWRPLWIVPNSGMMRLSDQNRDALEPTHHARSHPNGKPKFRPISQLNSLE